MTDVDGKTIDLIMGKNGQVIGFVAEEYKEDSKLQKYLLERTANSATKSSGKFPLRSKITISQE